MFTAKQVYNNIFSKIEAIYGIQEASSIAFIVLSYFDITKDKYVLNEKVHIDNEQLNAIIERLKLSEPVQYILEEAWFYDEKYIVDGNVLIPRPETEELCHLIINRNKGKNIKILDIGTGSGCIPITLKLHLPDCDVSCIDVSSNALNIAQKNAKRHQVDIHFMLKDILQDEVDLSMYDIVVSNPPYVLDSEKKLMQRNVLEYEPELALFVKDVNPLLFYQRIIALAVKGKVKELYFEINENFGEEVKRLLVTNGFENVSIIRDLRGKERMVYACNNS